MRWLVLRAASNITLAPRATRPPSTSPPPRQLFWPLAPLSPTVIIQIDPTKYVASLSLPSNIFSATHLSNQNYDICFRRESGYCAICFIPSITFGAAAATAATISAFGLSNQAADVKAETGTACISDYLIVSIFLIVFHGKTYIDGVLLQIRQAVGTAAIAIKQNEAIAGVDRLCGRFLSTTDDATFATYVAATNSVCSK